MKHKFECFIFDDYKFLSNLISGFEMGVDFPLQRTPQVMVKSILQETIGGMCFCHTLGFLT